MYLLTTLSIYSLQIMANKFPNIISIQEYWSEIIVCKMATAIFRGLNIFIKIFHGVENRETAWYFVIGYL